MGCHSIKVATLNCSSTNNSPFEFYSNNTEETAQIKALNRIFHRLIKQQPKLSSPQTQGQSLKDEFRWLMGPIDMKLQKERYSPIYDPNVGIIGDRIMNRQQFQAKWHEKIKQIDFSIFGSKQPKPSEIQRCLLFDFLLFKTFIEYCYSQVTGSQDVILADRPQNIDSFKKYQQLLGRYFQKQYLKDDYKIECLLKLANSHHILFLQDLSQGFSNILRKKLLETHFIRYEAKSGCAIMLQLQHFKEVDVLKKAIAQQRENKIVWAESSLLSQLFDSISDKPPAVCFIDDFMLLSIHLTSSEVRNKQQIEIIKRQLTSLKLTFSNIGLNKRILVGGDFNRLLYDYKNINSSDALFIKTFRYFPKTIKNTTNKKRTALQAQMHKTEVEDKCCRDFIILDYELGQSQSQIKIILQSGRFCCPQSNPSQQYVTLLPSDNHPFDHFIVSSTIK